MHTGSVARCFKRNVRRQKPGDPNTTDGQGNYHCQTRHVFLCNRRKRVLLMRNASSFKVPRSAACRPPGHQTDSIWYCLPVSTIGKLDAVMHYNWPLHHTTGPFTTLIHHRPTQTDVYQHLSENNVSFSDYATSRVTANSTGRI